MSSYNPVTASAGEESKKVDDNAISPTPSSHVYVYFDAPFLRDKVPLIAKRQDDFRIIRNVQREQH
jgi:hypothetical protein